MDHLIPAICEKLEFRGKPCQRTPTGNCAEGSATRGAVDQKTRPPDGFAAAVRAGFQSIAQDTSPGRLALNRVARSSTHSICIEVVIAELLVDRSANSTDSAPPWNVSEFPCAAITTGICQSGLTRPSAQTEPQKRGWCSLRIQELNVQCGSIGLCIVR